MDTLRPFGAFEGRSGGADRAVSFSIILPFGGGVGGGAAQKCKGNGAGLRRPR